jgi:hypothetical protein
MTEADWLAFANTDAVPDFLRDKASHRKLLLFACARDRRIQLSSMDSHFGQAVELSERYADGLATDQERREVIERLNAVKEEAIHEQDFEKCAAVAHCAELVTSCKDYPRRVSSSWTPYLAEPPVQYYEVHKDGFHRLLFGTRYGPADLLLDIFGNPFRPITLDPSWLTPTVKTLAQAIYEERTFEDLPVLGDALEDAGCNNEDVLSHCRGPGPHTRGCWVVDLLLGKE